MKRSIKKGTRSSARGKPAKARKKLPENNHQNGDQWQLRLYVAGQTPKSMTALANLKRFCETNLRDKYQIEVVDLAKNPALARSDQIIAIPTLVRKLPEPLRKIIGDLSDTQRVLVTFDLKPLS